MHECLHSYCAHVCVCVCLCACEHAACTAAQILALDVHPSLRSILSCEARVRAAPSPPHLCMIITGMSQALSGGDGSSSVRVWDPTSMNSVRYRRDDHGSVIDRVSRAMQLAVLTATHHLPVRRVCFTHGGDWVATVACGACVVVSCKEHARK